MLYNTKTNKKIFALFASSLLTVNLPAACGSQKTKIKSNLGRLIASAAFLLTSPILYSLPASATVNFNVGLNAADAQDLQNIALNHIKSSSKNEAELYFEKGYQLFQNKDHQGAIKNYNLALRIYPNLTKVYYYRGLARYELGDIEGARKDFLLSPNDYSSFA